MEAGERDEVDYWEHRTHTDKGPKAPPHAGGLGCGNPSQKPWVNKEARLLLKAHDTAFRSDDAQSYSSVHQGQM